MTVSAIRPSRRIAAVGATIAMMAAALAARNVDDVRLVGGTGRLSNSLVTQIKAVAPNATVSRYIGTDVGGKDDRYGTNASIIERVTGVKAAAAKDEVKDANGKVIQATVTATDHVFLATGQNWPNALAGVPAAAKVNSPLALTFTNCVPQVTSDVLGKLPVKQATQLGQSGVLTISSLGDVCTW